MDNINEFTKFEDNRSKQSGLRVHTSLKMGGGHLGNKMADVELDPEKNAKKTEDDIFNGFAEEKVESEGKKRREKKSDKTLRTSDFHWIS